MLKQVLIMGWVGLATPALAQTVVESHFEVVVTDAAGEQTAEATTIVPLRNGACYSWWLRFDKTKGDIDVTETLMLPYAPATWGTQENTTISEDRRTAVSTYSLTPTDGWIGHEWCAAKGDPVGEHLIEVRIDDELVGSFPFVAE
jgi:hypothetical protein